MQADPGERGLLHVEEVQEDERFQNLTKVTRAHQPRDRAVAAAAGATDDLARLRLDRSGRREPVSFSHFEFPSQSQSGCATCDRDSNRCSGSTVATATSRGDPPPANAVPTQSVLLRRKVQGVRLALCGAR